MDFLARGSDSDYAFQLQMEEALAASLSLQSQKPPSPPIVARCGFAIADQNCLRPKSEPTDVRLRNRGYDFEKAAAKGNSEGNAKGKGKIHEIVTGVRTDDRNPNFRVGNFQNTSAYDTTRPSPVILSQETVRPAQLVGEGSLKANAAAGNFNGNVWYRLYFKGLVSEEIGKGNMTDVLAGFGVAICDQRDNLLFELKGPLIDHGTNRQGAEIKALTRGLAEALNLGIKHVAFFCDSFPIFQFVTGKWGAKQKKISMLMNDLQRIRQQFSRSQPVLVAGNDVKFAYKLARESIVSQVTPHEDPRQAKASRKEECVICYNDINADCMFSVDRCRHRFCFQCVKQHVEVKLLHGMAPKCPHDGCKSELTIDACGKLLTPKLSEMWKQRIKENAIPVTERVYCPYPRCSALMSKTKISEAAKSLLSLNPNSGVRRCVECRGLFCVDCKVPWHGQMSCADYKRLHPNPPADDVKLKSLANNKMWRQCSKCQHMIELSQGCNHITCRCGYEFCYNCGGGWNKNAGTCVKRCPTWNEAYIIRQDPVRAYGEPHMRQGPVPAYVAPNNYFEEDDDVDYEDFEYEYDGNLHLGQEIMNGFDPFFDLPDGEIFTPDMLFPDERFQQLYLSDYDSDDMDFLQEEHTHTVPVNAPASNEGKAEEISQYHFSYNNALTAGNAPPANLQDQYIGMYGGGDFDPNDYEDDNIYGPGDYLNNYEDDYNYGPGDYNDYLDPFHPDYHQ